MTALALVREALADDGLRLDRALPRAADHLLLMVTDADGASVAGQWFADPVRAGAVASRTAAAALPGRVRRVGAHVVLQAGGADRRLPALAALASRPGARLVAHRPERRAVVESADGSTRSFVKVVRPGRTAPVVDGLAVAAAAAPFRTPEVCDSDDAAGTVTTRALAGTTLHDALTRMTLPVLQGHLAEVGTLLARLHAAAVPPTAGGHTAADEVAVVRRWCGLARSFGALPVADSLLDQETWRLERLLGTSAPSSGLLHRDLHDKQLVVGGGGRPGLLDLDLLAAGDPALDLANLVVHLELRARQGRISAETAVALAGRLVTAYAPSPAVRATARGHLLATRLRLVAVYAFRPAHTAAAVDTLLRPLMKELP